jgi:hypothetical protein
VTDTREQIIVQLVTLLANVSGLLGVYRNRSQLPDDLRPAAIVLDGNEKQTTLIAPQKTVKMPPAIMALRPQIFVLLPIRTDQANTIVNGVFDPVGPELSQYRIQVLDAVINDPTLINLVGGPRGNGQIEYLGCDTDMQTGMAIGTLGAELQMHFEFRYVLQPPTS